MLNVKEEEMKMTFRAIFALALAMLGFAQSGCQPIQPTSSVPVTQVLPTHESLLPIWWMNPTLSLQAPIPISATTDIPYTSEELLDVYAPVSTGDWPIVVVFHGAGDYKGMVSDLARAIAEQGAVVFAPTFHSNAPKPSSRIDVGAEDAACAIRFARAHASAYGGQADRVIVVGHSAGGLMGALMMFAGDEFHGDCLTQEGSALPDAFVGLDGTYDPIAFTPDEVLQASPADCIKIDPFTYIKRKPKRENISFLLFIGSYETTQRHGQAFRDALQAAGYEVQLVQIPGINHNDMARPQPQTLNAIAELLHP
jgi:acetyl esterase/lipase